MIMRTRRALALAATTGALAIALSGCSLLGGGDGDAGRDNDGQVTESASIGVFSLEVGDCMLSSPSGLLEDIDVVPCEEPHDEEVYHEITMPDGEYSADDINNASLECIAEPFTTFIGISKEESALQVYPITPTPESWDSLDDRLIQCVVFSDAGETTGSLGGSGL